MKANIVEWELHYCQPIFSLWKTTTVPLKEGNAFGLGWEMNCEYITSHCTWICLAFGRKNLLVLCQGFFASTWHKHHFLFWTFTFFSYHHFSLTFHQLLKCFNKNGDSLKKKKIFSPTFQALCSKFFRATVVKLLLKRFFAKGKMGKKVL